MESLNGRPICNNEGQACRFCRGVCCPTTGETVGSVSLQFCELCLKHHDFDCDFWQKWDEHSYCDEMCTLCHKCYDITHECQFKNVFESEFSSDGYTTDGSDEKSLNYSEGRDEFDEFDMSEDHQSLNVSIEQGTQDYEDVYFDAQSVFVN